MTVKIFLDNLENYIKNTYKFPLTFGAIVKNSELIKVWGMPDNSRVTSKQLSFRLPVHVAAKISALCDMFPNKTRTEIIGDLLTSALEGVEYSFPSIKGEKFDMTDEDGNQLYIDIGGGIRFRNYANKHYIELEKELGNEKPEPLYDAELLCKDSDL